MNSKDRSKTDRSAEGPQDCAPADSKDRSPRRPTRHEPERTLDPFDLGALHARLAILREQCSLREIAELTDHHPETVRRYFSSSQPSVPFIKTLAEVFDVRVDWLLWGEGPMRRSQEIAWRLEVAPIDLLLRAAVERLLRRLEELDPPGGSTPHEGDSAPQSE
jgi:hypothetical protein